MIKLVRNILILFISAASPATFALQAVSYQEALSIAKKMSPMLVKASADFDSAKARLKRTRSLGYPSLILDASVAGSNNPLSVFGYKLSQGTVSFADFGFEEFSGPSSLNTQPSRLNSPNFYSNYNGSLILNVPLFTSGEWTANKDSAAAFLAAAKDQSQVSFNQLSYQLLDVYQRILTYQQMRLVLASSMQRADAYLALSQSLFENARILSSDVSVARVYRRQIENQYYSVSKQRDSLIALFNQVLGTKTAYRPSQPVSVQFKQTQLSAQKQSELVQSPELQALAKMNRGRKRLVDAAAAKAYPQISMQIKQEWNTHTFSSLNAATTGLIHLQWTLFNFGQLSALKQEATAQYLKSKADYQAAVNEHQYQFAKALNQIKTAQQNVKTAKLAVQEYRKAERSIKKRYGQGLMPLGQLLDMSHRLDQSQIDMLLAQHQLLMAKAQAWLLVNQLQSHIQ